jgi:hypothetical protein
MYLLERNRLITWLTVLERRTLLLLAPALLAFELATALLAARQGWLGTRPVPGGGCCATRAGCAGAGGEWRSSAGVPTGSSERSSPPCCGPAGQACRPPSHWPTCR